jgi:hypothetical protein
MFNFQYLHNYSCPRIQSLPATIIEDWLTLSSVKILASSHHQSRIHEFLYWKVISEATRSQLFLCANFSDLVLVLLLVLF